MSHPWFNEQVERRVQEWIAQREQQRRKEAERHRPIIAVGGDHGALREHVARRVAGRLGYSYWDREILHELAHEGHIPQPLLEQLDERRINRWSEAFAGFRLRSRPRSADYARVLKSFVEELADTGRAVIVGRGVRFLLKSKVALRVHVSAPLEHRVRTVMSVQHLGYDDAVRHVKEVDAERADYVRELFDADLRALDDIDLVVNSGTLGVENAAQTIVDTYQRRFETTD
jgi:cytidylate kinase